MQKPSSWLLFIGGRLDLNNLLLHYGIALGAVPAVPSGCCTAQHTILRRATALCVRLASSTSSLSFALRSFPSEAASSVAAFSPSFFASLLPSARLPSLPCSLTLRSPFSFASFSSAAFSSGAAFAVAAFSSAGVSSAPQSLRWLLHGRLPGCSFLCGFLFL